MQKITNTQRTQALRSAPLGRLLIQYTLPSLTGMMVMALYNIVDRIMIGQGVGQYAIAGLTLTFPLTIFLQAFGMMIGTGASARVSIAMGREDTDQAGRILGNAMLLTFITQAAILTPSMIWLDELLRLFGGSERTIPYAAEYMRLIIPFNLFSTLCFSYNHVMRASGYPAKAMYTMLIGALLNAALDYLFIFHLHLGISGAAWATNIAMIISSAFVMAHFFRSDATVHFQKHNFRPSSRAMLSITSIGASPFFLQLLGSAVTIIYNKSFILHSPTPTQADMNIGAYGIIGSYVMLAIMFFLGISQGMQPIVGYNYGAGNMQRVRLTFRACATTTTLIAILTTLAAILIPDTICGIFTSGSELTSAAAHGLRLCLWGFIVIGYQVTSSQFLQSIGRARHALLLSISRQLFFLMPLLLILPSIYSLDGIWYATSAADFLSGILAYYIISKIVKI